MVAVLVQHEGLLFFYFIIRLLSLRHRAYKGWQDTTMKQTKLKHSEATEDISCGDTYFYRLVFKYETQWRES